MKHFGHSIPPELVKHVRAMCGEAGEPWLRTLPLLIEKLETRWDVKIGIPFPAVEFNYVSPAVSVSGEQMVVKIAPPFESTEIFGEAKFLRTCSGKGCVCLLAEDRGAQAILIERALPGENIAEFFAGREPKSVAPAIEVLRTVQQAPPSDIEDVIYLDDWFDGMRRFRDTQFPEFYAKKALDIYEDLSKESGFTFYLHGDFHPGNIVTATREAFLAIDPKGIVGHLGYEIAVFLNNFHWWQSGERNLRSRLESAIGQFAEAFGIGGHELRQWAFAQMVLSAWWTFDEMPQLYNNEVAKADIWDV